MTLLGPTQTADPLSPLAQQVAPWRQNRPNPRGSRIPEPRWAEALRLAQGLPLTRVARHLGLKPHALQRRRGDHGNPRVTARPLHAACVEVTADAGHAATAEVEVHRPAGTRVRSASHAAVPALAPLLQPLLEHH
jgi:hypothetical protein